MTLNIANYVASCGVLWLPEAEKSHTAQVWRREREVKVSFISSNQFNVSTPYLHSEFAMNQEQGFLGKLLENPSDDTTRLVYADWLEECGDKVSKSKADFLRLITLLPGANEEATIVQKLQGLAAALDTDWLAIVSKLGIDSCGAKRGDSSILSMYGRQFEFVCDKRWDELTATEHNGIRYCQGCQKNVYYCDTIDVARRHAGKNHCVAIDLGIIRRKNDLVGQKMILVGTPSKESLREQEEQSKVDEVSLAREQKKQNDRSRNDRN
jgi:uncharacterized protein (TIGR02996 family)